MIHDRAILKVLEKLPSSTFSGEVFRATSVNADPLAFSTNGGRWAIPSSEVGNFAVLYTSMTREGALSEVASYLGDLTPVPKVELCVHKLDVYVDEPVRIAVDKFGVLGIEKTRYGERNYTHTQKIAAAANFLGFDGLIAPSARYDCQNLIIFKDNHQLEAKLEALSSERVPHKDWIKFPHG